MAAWLYWFLRSAVPVFEVSRAARMESDLAPHTVQSVMAGRVLALRAVIGQQVCTGDVLVELDATASRIRLREEETHRTVLVPQLEALRREITTERRAAAEDLAVDEAAIDEAQSHQRESRAAARFAEERAAQLARMTTDHLVAGFDLQAARSEAEQRRWADEVLQRTIARLQRQRDSHRAQRLVRIEQLGRDEASLSAQAITADATVARLTQEIELFTLRAPVCGRVGELVPVRAGTYLQAGDRLMTIVPPGRIRIVADFLARDTLGRVRPGQTAIMRLDGFPWTEFGTLPATVVTVASESRDGALRVELSVRMDLHSAVPIQHGLTGSVEVEVARLSPAELLLRAAGRWRAAAER